MTITNSFNSGSISTKGDGCCAAGISGWNATTHLTNVYNTGSVIGHDSVGGLLGYVETATIEDSYSSGAVTGTDATSTGALIGEFGEETMTNTYWNNETSAQTTPCGSGYSCDEGTYGITSAQMRTQSTYADTWDYTEVWGICEYFNNGFPYLLWQNPTCAPPTPGLPNTGRYSN